MLAVVVQKGVHFERQTDDVLNQLRFNFSHCLVNEPFGTSSDKYGEGDLITHGIRDIGLSTDDTEGPVEWAHILAW